MLPAALVSDGETCRLGVHCFSLSDSVAQPTPEIHAGARSSLDVCQRTVCKCTFGICGCASSRTTTRHNTGVNFANDRTDESKWLKVGMYVSRERMYASGHGATVRSVRDQEPQKFDENDMMLTNNTALTCTQRKQNDEKHGRI